MNAIHNIDSAILYGIYYTPHMLYEYYTILTLILYSTMYSIRCTVGHPSKPPPSSFRVRSPTRLAYAYYIPIIYYPYSLSYM